MSSARKHLRSLILLFALCTAGALAAAGSAEKPPPPPPPLTLSRLLHQAALRDPEGRPVRVTNLKRRPTIVIFWETWCSACAEEVPVLNRTWERYHGEDLQFLGISVTVEPAELKAAARERRIGYPVFVGERRLAQEAQVVVVPTLLCFDRDGRLVKRLVGVQSEEAVAQIVEQLLAQPEAPAPREDTKRGSGDAKGEAAGGRGGAGE